MLESKQSGPAWPVWALCAGLALAAVVVWYLRIIAPAAIPIAGPAVEANSASDLQLYSYGMWHRAPPAADALWLWNPHQLGGHPFLATLLSGVLYPPAWLARLLPTAAALEAANVFHMAIAGIFTFLYGRAISLGFAASLLAAITFMFSGFVAGEASWFTPASGSAVWLPLGMLAIEKIFATQRSSWSVPLAIAIAMPVLSGWVQSWVYSMYVLGSYAALRVVLAARGPGGLGEATRLAAITGFGALAGIALCAAQLLPSLELMSLGPRRPDSLSVSRILALGPTTPLELWRLMTDGSPGFGRFAYAGLTAIVLAPIACFARAQRFRAIFLLVVAIFALSVVAASSSEWFELYFYVPGGGLFRKPQRILYLWAFAAALLSGIGFQALRDATTTDARARVATLLALGASVLAAAGVAGSLQLRSALCLLVAIGAGACAATATTRLRELAALAIVAAVLVDLVGALRNPYVHPFHDTTGIDRAAPIFDHVRERQGYARTYLHDDSGMRYALMHKQGTLRGLYTVRDYEPLSTQRHKSFFRALEGAPEDAQGKYTFTGQLIADPSKESFRILDLLSVRFLVTIRNHEFESALRERGGWRRLQVDGPLGFRLYERARVLPRAYFAAGHRSAATHEEALRIVANRRFDPWREVVIEGEGGSSEAAGPIAAAQLVQYEPERVVLEVDAPSAGYVVLTDSHYPGWRAEVDGEPAEILRANGLLRAVAVDSGPHRVVFEYRPASFWVGAALSLTSGASLLAILALGRRRARRG